MLDKQTLLKIFSFSKYVRTDLVQTIFVKIGVIAFCRNWPFRKLWI